MTQEFRDFLLKTNMFALALGVIIGGAVGKVVEAIVHDLFMPVLGVLSAQGNWREITLSFWRFNFTLGHLFGTVLDFAVIAGIVFVLTKFFVRQSAPPPTKGCPECMERIHPEAKKCRFCGSKV